MNRPKTLEEARQKRYGEWAGNPNGRPYDPSRCAYEIFRNHIGRQCSRRPRYGPDNLYCRQHSKQEKNK